MKCTNYEVPRYVIFPILPLRSKYSHQHPQSLFKSPCHLGMTRPRVANGGDSRQGVVLQFGGWTEVNTSRH